jgi:hypothetical protein
VTRMAELQRTKEPDDHIEVCALFEDLLERARRGEFAWAGVVVGDREHFDTAVVGDEHELSIVGGLSFLCQNILDGREGVA